MKRFWLLAATTVVLTAATGAAIADGAYKNFRAAIYVTVDGTHRLADPKVREAQYQRIASQLRFDKVYLETYRSGRFADDATLDILKKFFTDHGIAVAGGIAYSAPEHGGQSSVLN